MKEGDSRGSCLHKPSSNHFTEQSPCVVYLPFNAKFQSSPKQFVKVLLHSAALIFLFKSNQQFWSLLNNAKFDLDLSDN